tara:strand:+ start:647 stop:2737 length:2091 start_codon:yes stop_codon:yes gene_type:complete
MGDASKIRILYAQKTESTPVFSDITRLVSINSFPEFFEKSLKGKGWFDFEVKSFSFRVLVTDFDSIPKRLDWVQIYSLADNSLLMDGFIDEMKDELADDPQFTIFPKSLLLKDTIIGEVEESAEESEQNFTYDSGATLPLWELVQDIANKTNIKAGTNFTATDQSVPIVESTNKNFFGNLFDKIRKWDFIYRLLSFLLPGMNLSDTFRIFRKSDSSQPSGYSYFAIKKDAGFLQKTWFSQGQFLDFSFSWGFYLGWPFNKSIGFSFNLEVPSRDYKFPTLMARGYVYNLIAGGYGDNGQENAVYEWFPLFPWGDGPPSFSQYGEEYNGWNSQNISEQKASKFLDEEGYTNPTAVVSFDYDANNSYAIIGGKPRKFDLSPWYFLASFETPFDNHYRVTYKNATASEMLRDLSVVSNRFFYVDDNGLIYMTPRNNDGADKNIKRKNLITLEQNTIKEADPKVDFNAYKTDDKGKVISYGVRVREKEKTAILAYYKKFFQGQRVERKFEIYTGIDDVDINLMDTIILDGDDTNNISQSLIGRVIKKDISFLEHKKRFTCEVASDFIEMGDESGGDGLNIDLPGGDSLPNVSITSPSSNSIHGSDDDFLININWNNVNFTGNVKIILMQIAPGNDFYTNYEVLASNISNVGNYNFTLTNFSGDNIIKDRSYRLKVKAMDGEIEDIVSPIYFRNNYSKVEV